jgi:hypothetical protein
MAKTRCLAVAFAITVFALAWVVTPMFPDLMRTVVVAVFGEVQVPSRASSSGRQTCLPCGPLLPMGNGRGARCFGSILPRDGRGKFSFAAARVR